MYSSLNLPTNLNPGKTYIIKFTAKGVFYPPQGPAPPIPNAVDKFNVVLTNGLTPINSCDDQSTSPSKYLLPSYAFSMYNLGYFNTAIDVNWRCFSVSFTPPPGGNFNQIWFYPEISYSPPATGGAYQDDIWFDDVILISKNSCTPDVTYDGNTNVPNLTSVSNKIIAKNATQIVTGQTKKFKAENEISLLPGFIASTGSDFDAYISLCSSYDRSITNTYPPIINFPNNNQNPDFTKSTTGDSLYVPNDDNNTKLHENNSLNDSLTIFPNPNNGSFTISFSDGKVKDIYVYNVLGEIIFMKKETKEQTINISVSDFPKGIYFVKITNELGTKVEKVVYQ